MSTHSPSGFDPAKYTYVDSIYQGPYATNWDNDPSTRKMISESSWKGNFEEKGTCDHCGASFHYGAVFTHTNGDVIVVGHVCAENAFGCDNRREYDLKRLKDSIAAIREQKKHDVALAKIFSDNPGLEEAFECDHKIIKDIARRLQKWGSISEKQIALVIKLAAQVKDRKEEDAYRKANVPPIVEGRREVLGVILSTKEVDTHFGFCQKMLVEEDEGTRVWGTIPAALLSEVHAGDDPELKGLRVAFTGTVKKSNDDHTFGFFSRPSKGRVVSA